MRTVVMDRNHVAGWFVGLLEDNRVVRLWGLYGYEEAKRIAESAAKSHLNTAELAVWRQTTNAG